MTQLSIKLGNLVMNHQTPESDELRVIKYMQNLTSIRETAVGQVMDSFPAPKVTGSQFVE